jgi:hypothetical protein
MFQACDWPVQSDRRGGWGLAKKLRKKIRKEFTKKWRPKDEGSCTARR